MYGSPRKFIETVGGYRAVAKRIGSSPNTLHSHLSAGHLPAKLYKALVALASEEGVPPPEMDLFKFVKLQALPATDGRDAA